MVNLTQLTASQARTKLYSLIKTAGQGLKGYEINLRGSEPVVLISKSELESWQESLDILNHPHETAQISQAQQESTSISHDQLLQELGMNSQHESQV